MTTTETDVTQLKINRLTKIQYEAQTTIGANELSLIDPEFTGSKVLVTDANGDIAESAVTSTEIGYIDGVTSNIQTQLNGKQATISNLSTIESNASNGQSAYTTIQGYGNIVTHNASEFYLSTNPDGYITGITSSDVTTALGYTPYNSTNPNNYISGITSSDVTTALGYTPLANTTKYGADLSYSNSQLQLKDQDGNALGNAVTIESSPAIDNSTITTNSSSQLQASGVIDNNTSSALKVWTGTKAQYDAITTKDSNTLYNVTDDYTGSTFSLPTWTNSYISLLDGSSAGTFTVDFSSYLPNDGKNYEVLFRVYLNASSSTFYSCYIYGGLIVDSSSPLYVGSVQSAYKYATNVFTYPIGASRTMSVVLTGALSRYQIQAFGYKEIG